MSADPLFAALESRYVVERELGHGGMATVYLARDLQHDRPVALKVMLPDIGAAMGADRFRREIRLVAQLQHPHIVPVFDSGEAADRLWFTMPFIQGESLRARLEREHQLPLPEVARITAQVAAALDEAHRAGVLHRDVKPENILLTAGGDAMLADFGVARPVARGSGATLTADGFAIGTPAYMSPEQITGDIKVDGRSDVYALACVVHEMLTGEPPHLGGSIQNILAKRLTDGPVSVRKLRQTVPAAWDAALARALASAPADRFSTAGAFAAALGAPPAPVAKRRPLLIAVAAAAVVLVVAALWLGHARHAVSLDRSLLAVLPFRVASADTAIAYLGEGMVDLLAVKFTGEGGPRALDPRATVSAWRRLTSGALAPPPDAAPRVARGLGAGLVLDDGAVVGDAHRLTLSATLSDVGGGRGLSASVSGPSDSLPQLVDRLASELLADRAGEQSRSLVGVTSLPALRAYLSGRVNTRRGHYAQAQKDFDRALDEDSGFALAALGSVRLVTRGGAGRHDAAAIAWRGRAAFSPANQALLLALLGPEYPRPSSQIAGIEAVRHVTELAPDNAEGWFELGDRLLHTGQANGIEDAIPAARGAFMRALALDSSYYLPIEHLVRLAIATNDTALLRRWLPPLLAGDTLTDWFSTIRWNAAHALGDSAIVRDMRRRVETAIASGQSCGCQPDLIAASAQANGLAPDDAILAARVNQAASPGDRVARFTLEAALVNVGRPAEAAAWDRPLAGERRESVFEVSIPLFEALMNNGDPEAGRRAETALAGIGRDRGRSATEQSLSQCLTTLASTVHQDSSATARPLGSIPSPPSGENPGIVDDVVYCHALVDAWRSAFQHRADARALVVRADSIGIRSLTSLTPLGYLLEGLAGAEGGDVSLGRRIIGRDQVVQAGDPMFFYAAYLRERGRVALLDHDTAAAREFWRHYLALRVHAEPAVKPSLDSIAGRLASLR